MNQNQVADLLKAVDAGEVRLIRFITPAASTMIAAYFQKNRDCGRRIRFNDKAHGYAENVGLLSILTDTYQPPRRGGQQGVTYTKLTRLHWNSEVEGCNAIINDLLAAQLPNDDSRVVQLFAKVVGELHDNVASHANGSGFSAAQVYKNQVIRFSIADAGQGMLRNVQRVTSSIVSDRDAICWCMRNGNTTAKPDDFLAQRLPEDAICSPYPEGAAVSRIQNHHAGLGLWHLSKLVSIAHGTFSVLSGTGIYRVESGRSAPIIRESPFHWPGVAIEFQITLPRDGQPAIGGGANLDDVARRLGL